ILRFLLLTRPPEMAKKPDPLPRQLVPTPVYAQVPSKLPTPPSSLPRGCSASRLRGVGEPRSDEGSDREPDRDFSSLPILPPALPDCASDTAGPITSATKTQRKEIPNR